MNDWLLILIVAPLLIGMSIQVMQRLVLGRKSKREMTCVGWRRVYYITVPWHATLIGALIGLAGYYLTIPVPELFGTGLAGAVLAYAFAGAVSIIAYDKIVIVVKRITSTAAP